MNDKSLLKFQAESIVKEPCCTKCCLFKRYTLDVAVQHVYKCLKEVALLNFDDKKSFLRYDFRIIIGPTK